MTPNELTIGEAVRRVHRGELSSRALVEACLARIAAVDPAIQAWARVCGDIALAEAERIDRLSPAARRALPLAGVPFGVKDVFCTRGVETSAGSRVLRGWVPDYDAAAVVRVKAAGGVLLGKTATTEFASADPAPTRNPRDLEHTPGGSSAGSAAAIAADMCLGALGTQTAGSILRPAAYCGVVGFKPTYGATRRDGVLPLAWSLDHVGPITKTVEDAALVFAQLVEPTAPARVPPPRTLRIGIPDRYFDDATPAVADAIDAVIARLADLGWSVTTTTLPVSFEAAMAAATIILPVEVAAFHDQWFDRAPEAYGPKLRSLIEAGQCVPGPSYLRAQRVRTVAVAEFRATFETVDLLLTATTPAPAPRGLESTGDAKYLWPLSCLGVPTLTLPIPAPASPLPVGLQLVGAHGADWTVLAAGQALEAQLATRRA